MNFPGVGFAPRALAGKGVPAFAAILLAAGGCLVPQSVDPESTRPHTIPRVDLTKLPDYFLRPEMLLYPQGPSDLTSNPPCHCELDVHIPSILADDPTVNVEARWFVDYDLSVPRSQSPVSTVVIPGSFQTPDTSRTMPDFVINADALGLVQGTHLVELVMAEQAGFDLDTKFPPHRATKTDYEASTLKFVVRVTRDPIPGRPTCDLQRQAPQVQRCP